MTDSDFSTIKNYLSFLKDNRWEMTFTSYNQSESKNYIFRGMKGKLIKEFKNILEKIYDLPSDCHSVLLENLNDKQEKYLLFSPVSSADFKNITDQLKSINKQKNKQDIIVIDKYIALNKNKICIYDLHKTL